MAQAKANRIANSYAEINKAINSGGNHIKIIKASNRIINEDPSQEEAWMCKIVSQIQSEQFMEAKKTILKAPTAQSMKFEEAYCLYRMNEIEEALAVLESCKDKHTLKEKELLAQIHYRLEKHTECHAVYRELVRSQHDDFDVERLTNMGAVQNVAKQGLPEEPPRSCSSYEQWYNSACAAVAVGNAQACLSRLNRSMLLCEEMLKAEEASKAEIANEQALLRVLKGYALQVSGKEKEALSEYESVLALPLEDPALLAILHNNVATLPQAPGESRKRLRAGISPAVEHKLTKAQRLVLQLNNCILSYTAQQNKSEDPALEASLELLQNCPDAAVAATAVVLLAASRAKAGKLDAALQLLQGSKGSAGMVLTTAHLRLMKNDVLGAARELSSLPEGDKMQPGIVGALVSLYQAKKQVTAITELVRSVGTYYQGKKLKDEGVIALVQYCADHLSKEKAFPQAAALLEALRDAQGDQHLPDLIYAYSKFDSAKGEVLSQQVRLPTELLAAMDAEALEASVGQRLPKPDEPLARRKKVLKKKKRKTVLPKNYVRGEKPDPERWLPRWQRKNKGLKRRGKGRKRDGVGKGTQGGAGDNADSYDIRKNQDKYKNLGAPEKQEPQGPRRNMPKKKGKKK